MAAPLIRQILDLHRRQLFGVIEVRGVGRLKKIYADARAELEDKLRALKAAGRGDTFQAHHLEAILAQVTDAVSGMTSKLTEHLERTGREAGTMAPRHLAHMIGEVEEHLGGMTPIIQATQVAVVRGAFPSVASSLLQHHRESARRYGPQAVTAIREGLASSLVQGEKLDEAVDRVSGTSGLFVGQRWRAERIVRTETSYSYGVTNQRAMEQMRPAVPKMMKRLVTTFDVRTGDDSEELNGQTVPVDQPFRWEVRNSRGEKTGKVVLYMQPPNRPNDREVVIPWLPGWSPRGLAEPGPVDPEPPRN